MLCGVRPLILLPLLLALRTSFRFLVIHLSKQSSVKKQKVAVWPGAATHFFYHQLQDQQQAE